MPDQRPTRLGNFELIARIAKGGMAEIYLARQGGDAVSRLVVVKRILPHLAEERLFVQMFLEEARLAAMISHPNVVQIIEVGESEGEYFIAMEYIEGPSVGRLARHTRETKKPLPTEVAAALVVQACGGLHAAHQLCDESGDPLGLVHRDVSPHNLMVTSQGIVKLVDFGVAKAHDSAIHTHTGGLKGKFPYMSPEQCRGEPLDRRTDIFSLGIIFHELVTAQRLFARPSELLTLKAISEEAIPDAQERNSELPDAINDVLRRALAKDRADRFATAAEMGEATRAALSALNTPANPAILAEYLDAEFGELLSTRQASVRRLAAKPTGGMPPVVGDFIAAHDDFGDSSRDGVSTRNERRGALAHRVDRVAAEALTAVDPRRQAPRDPAFHADDTLVKQGKRGLNLRKWVIIGSIAAVLGGGILGLVYRQIKPPGPPLRFGMAPVYPEATVRKELGPLTKYLQRKLGRRVKLVVTKHYRDLRKRLLAGTVDFASLTPLQFVRAQQEAPHLQLLASSIKEGARTYQSLLLTKAGGGITKVSDLRGKRICYVDPGSASGFVMARHYLRKMGINPKRDVRSVISGTHADVLRDLMADKCAAGATNAEAHRNARMLGVASSALQILAITGDLPNDMLSPSPTLDQAIVSRLRRALLDLNPQRDLGRLVVAETYPTSAFVAPRPEDFAPLAAAARAEK